MVEVHAGAREGVIAGKGGGIISRYASQCWALLFFHVWKTYHPDALTEITEIVVDVCRRWQSSPQVLVLGDPSPIFSGANNQNSTIAPMSFHASRTIFSVEIILVSVVGLFNYCIHQAKERATHFGTCPIIYNLYLYVNTSTDIAISANFSRLIYGYADLQWVRLSALGFLTVL